MPSKKWIDKTLRVVEFIDRFDKLFYVLLVLILGVLAGEFLRAVAHWAWEGH